MKINLKKKVMLALLAGSMLCTNSAFAATLYDKWYGTTGGFVHTQPNPAVVSGVNLTIDDTTCNIDDEQKHADSVRLNIYGGYTTGNDTVSNNSLTIALNSIQVSAEIYAGYSYEGEACGNKLIINSGTVNNDVYGGCSERGEASGNKLIINSGTINRSVYGGYSGYSGYGPGSGKVSKNEVTINSGTINNDVYSGSSVVGEVSENKLSINNVTIEGNVYGGRTNSGVASKNEVTINNSTITGKVYGGYTNYFDDAIGNEVTIKNGTISNGLVSGGYSYGGNATDNSITIEGGTFNNVTLYGGSGPLAGYGGNATDNSITIEGGTFNNVTLYGGFCGSGKTSSGNTLNLKTVINGTIKEIAKFQNVNFTIPAGMDREMTMLKVTTIPMVLDGVTFNVQNWSDGDYITLVKGVNGTEGALAGHTNFYVLDIGGTKELVYANGTPTARADYTLTYNGTKYNSEYSDAHVYSGDDVCANEYIENDCSVTTNCDFVVRRGTYQEMVVNAYSNTDGTKDVTDNKMTIMDGKFYSNITSGYRQNGGTVANNQTILEGGTYDLYAYGIAGGFARGGDFAVSQNTVTVNGGDYNFDNTTSYEYVDNWAPDWPNIVGGFVLEYPPNEATVTVDQNKVELNAGNFAGTGEIDGGKVLGTGNPKITGSVGGTSLETGNQVILDGANFAENSEYEIYGGKAQNLGSGSSVDANYNSATIKNTNVEDMKLSVYGGYTEIGSASYNNVTFKDSNLGFAPNSPTYECVSGGFTKNGNASNNIVTIDNSNIENEGYCFYFAGNTENGSADNNKFIINNSTLTSDGEIDIYGGNVTEEDNNQPEITSTITSNEVQITDSKLSKAYIRCSNKTIENSNVSEAQNITLTTEKNKVSVQNDVFEGMTGILGGNVLVESTPNDGIVPATITLNANENVISAKDSTFQMLMLCGVYVEGNIDSDQNGGSITANVNANKVELDNITADMGMIYGGLTIVGCDQEGVPDFLKYSFDENTVSVKNSEFTGMVQISTTLGQVEISSGEGVDDGTATDNELTIEGSTISGNNSAINTVNLSNGTAMKNKLTIKGSEVSGDNSQINTVNLSNGTATNNELTIVEGSTISGDSSAISTVNLSNGTATNNELTIEGSEVSGIYSKINTVTLSNGTATDNELTITGSEVSGENTEINTACISNGTATENKLTITGSEVSGDNSKISTVTLSDGTATDNELTITGSTISGKDDEIFTVSLNTGNATHNMATMTNGTVVLNGYSYFGAVKMESGTAEFNEVEVSASDCPIIVGVFVKNGTADTKVNENKVTVSGSVSKSVVAALLQEANQQGKAYKNVVKVSDGVYDSVSGAVVYKGEAEQNNVTIENSDSISVCGAMVIEGNVYQNTVNIDGGNISGDEMMLVGGYVDNEGNANENVVNIKSGNIGADDGLLAGGYAKGNANKNEVNIDGGKFTGGEDFTIAAGVSLGGSASENVLTITGGDFAAGICYYGGATESGVSSDNVLNLETVIAGEAQEVNYFQKMNFKIPSGATTDTVMIKSQIPVALHDSDDIAFTTVLNEELTLNDGEYITLIHNVDATNLSGSKWDADTEVYKWDDEDGYKYQILDFGSYQELVYGKGDINVKADFDIITGGITSKVGDCYYNDGYPVDDIDNTAKTYIYNVQGNTDVTDGTPTTSYSNNQVIVRRGTYTGTSDITGIFGAVNRGDATTINNNKVEIIGGKIMAAEQSYFVAGGFSLDSNDGDIVTNNEVIVHSLDVDTEDTIGQALIIGGYAFDNGGEAVVQNNKVKIENLNVSDPEKIYTLAVGGANQNGKVTENSVEINSGDYALVMGGLSGGGNAEKNTVTIHDGTYKLPSMYASMYPCAVMGGFVANMDDPTVPVIGNANFNEVLIENGTFTGNIAGGYVGANCEGDANENKVTIKDGTFEEGVNIYGGHTLNGNAEKNSVTLEAGSFEDDVEIYGGFIDKGNAKNNVVTINDGDYNYASVYGARARAYDPNLSVSVEKNIINITGGNFISYFEGFGGYLSTDIYETGTFSATGNEMNITGGNFDEGTMISGFGVELSFEDITGNAVVSANKNKVNVTGGTFGNDTIFFGSVIGDSGAENATAGTINISLDENEMNITGGEFGDGSQIYSACGMGFELENVEIPVNVSANKNKINLGEVTFGEETMVYGGYIPEIEKENVTGTVNASANNNEVIIDGTTFGNDFVVYGGNVMGAIGEACNNSIIVKDGTFGDGGLVGGCSTSSGTDEVSGNTVKIVDGTFGAVPIVGGSGQDTTGEVKNNLVEIDGGTFDTDGFALQGGYTDNGISSNNTLNLKIKMGGKASQVGFFQNMNFTLPADTGDVLSATGSYTMLNTTSLGVDGKGGTATVNVSAAGGLKLSVGDVITLVNSGTTIDNYVGGSILGGAGQFYYENEYGEDLNGDGDKNDLVITLLQDFSGGSSGNEDQEKAPVEGIAAMANMINQSADLAMGDGMRSLLANTDQPQAQKVTLSASEEYQNENTNGNVNADGELETETGIETDTDSYATDKEKKFVEFANTDTFGALTASRSKYQTGSHVDMDGWGAMVGVGETRGYKHGDKTSYGLFFEYGKGDFDTYNNDIHGEGNSKNEGVGVMVRQTLRNNTYVSGVVRYGKQDTQWSETEIGSYDTDSNYYGASVELGHIYKVEKDELDVYARYSYGHIKACDAKVKDSEYHFDGVISKRIRFGAKYNFGRIKTAKPYLGLAWEHELDGKCNAVISGTGEAPAPSMEGNTGILEFGIDWETGNWLLGLGGEAYVGKRKGISGTAKAYYNF